MDLGGPLQSAVFIGGPNERAEMGQISLPNSYGKGAKRLPPNPDPSVPLYKSLPLLGSGQSDFDAEGDSFRQSSQKKQRLLEQEPVAQPTHIANAGEEQQALAKDKLVMIENL